MVVEAGIVVVVDEVVVDVVADVIVVLSAGSSAELLHAVATSETTASRIPIRWDAWFRRLGIRTSLEGLLLDAGRDRHPTVTDSRWAVLGFLSI